MPKKNAIGVIDQKGCATSGINLGGIGTGGVELWPDGRFYFWNMVNSRPWAKAFKSGKADVTKGNHSIDPIQPSATDTDFFIRIHEEGKRPVYRWLFTGHGLTAGTASHFYRHHKYFFIKTFASIQYRAEYPFVYLTYIDPSFPIELTLRAWTSFIPRDVKNSSLPGAFFDFTLTNKSNAQLSVSLVWQQQNLSGYGASVVEQQHHKKEVAGASVVQMEGSLADPDHDTSGDMSIWALPTGKQQITSVAANPYMQNLIWPIHCAGNLEGPLMPPKIAREEINPTPPENIPNKGWLCIQDSLAPSATTEFNLGLSWFFPNHRSIRGTRVGHVYENWFNNSLEVTEYLIQNRSELLRKSSLMPTELMHSSLPERFKLSLLDQLNTLTKSTHFIKNGRVGLQEGHGCCAFNTVDVDHYSSYAMATLFPELRKKILEMQTALAHPENGKIHHGLPGTVEEIPSGGGANQGYSRWDVCCQYTLQVYRDTKWAGDIETMKGCWPTVKRAMELIATLDFYQVGLPYIEGGITYDHWHMKGVVTYMAGVYLAALRAMEDMADILGDLEARTWARKHFEKGRKNFEELLWNGEQYILFYGRRSPDWNPEDEARGEPKHFEPKEPPKEFCGPCCDRPKPYMELQDTGMMTDLLNGNATAGVMGLGTFLNVSRVKKQLKMTVDKNMQEENMCVVNGSYPDGHFLDEWPFAQWQTPWTGSEYFLALQLYIAGMIKEGDKVIDIVYERHVKEGMRFDHAECNNHYARPLCIWGAYAARLGLDYDGYRNVFTLKPPSSQKNYDGALITAVATGHLQFSRTATSASTHITVKDGSLPVCEIVLGVSFKPNTVEISINEQPIAANVDSKRGETRIALSEPYVVTEGMVCTISCTK